MLYNDIKKGQLDGNYQYDAIGNLVQDVSEGITNITWNVYGKISAITRSTGGNISYTYDAAGNRISKTHNNKTTWYVRDASGNVMSTYITDAGINSGNLTQSEIHLYGSSRLGVLNVKTNVQNVVSNNGIITFERANKLFELSNHLGNVLVKVSDKKIGVDIGGDGIIDFYIADVVSAQDYYPFGQLQPGRQHGTKGRYLFNGKEQDPEVKGVGNQYDYGFRIYDPRLGRFLSVDPLTDKYPWYTPYQFAGNKPIWCIDLDGLEDIPMNGGNYYSVESLKEAAFKDIRVSEAIRRGERVELRQTYSVSGNRIDRRIVLSPGSTGSNTAEVRQDGNFFEDGALGPSGLAQTFNPSIGIFQPTPPVPEPPVMPQAPPNPPINEVITQSEPKPKKPAPQQPKPQNPPKPKPPISNPQKPKQNPPVAPPPAPVPPPTPDPGRMCFVCFNGSDEPHFKGGVSDIVGWLKSNPNYNLKITADGGSSTLIKDTWKDKPWGSSKSYEQHTNEMFQRLKNAVKAAGGDPSRIIPQKGNADGRKLEYDAVKRGG